MFAWINRLDHYIPIRYGAWALCIVGFLASMAGWMRMGFEPWLAIFFGVLVLIGLRDVTQTRHAILRNYPVIGHLRFLLEFIRPEIRQYFIEDDRDAAPFSRQQRSLVYQRAKGDSDKRPFGTQLDVGAIGYEWINHSMQPTLLKTPRLPGADRRRPRPAVQRQHLQHLGDELRRALGQRDPRPQRRRQARRLRARHRRRLDQPASPGARRRPDLGDRLRLLRLLQRRRLVQRGAVRRQRPRSAGEDDRAQALARAPSRGTAGCCRDRR